MDEAANTLKEKIKNYKITKLIITKMKKYELQIWWQMNDQYVSPKQQEKHQNQQTESLQTKVDWFLVLH